MNITYYLGSDLMSINVSSKLGNIMISNEVIAEVIGLSAMECPGVIGMASKKRLKDGMAELLKRENYSRGIVVKTEEDKMIVDLHIVVLYGVNISEIAKSVQSRVKLSLESMIGISFDAINVLIEDVKITEDK